MPKTIFISYSWGNRDIIDKIDNDLTNYGITLVRDIRDLPFKASIEKFMMQIKKTDYALLLISDNYLKSKNCMIELCNFIESNSFKKKSLPIVLKDAKIFDAESRLDYYKYWENEITKLNEKIKSLKTLNNTNNLINELSICNKIRTYIDKIFEAITTERCLTYEEFIECNYLSFFKYTHIDKKQVFDVIKEMFSVDNYEEKELLFIENVIFYSNSPDLFCMYGIDSFRAGFIRKAKFILELVLNMDPNHSKANNFLGLLLVQKFNDLKNGRKYLEKSIKLDSKNSAHYNNYAVSLLSRIDEFPELIDEIIDLFGKAINLNPTPDYFYGGLAQCYRDHKKDLNKAKECFDKALNIKLKLVYIIQLIIICCQRKEFEDALHYSSIGLGKFDSEPDIHNYTGIIYSVMGKFYDAYQHYINAIKLDEFHLPAYVNIANDYRQTKIKFISYNQAKDAYLFAINRDMQFSRDYLNKFYNVK